jgi:SMODS and SLOG-associating 2TM effector domain 2
MFSRDLSVFRINTDKQNGVSGTLNAYQELRKQYIDVIKWYLEDKKRKARYSKTLRLASLTLAILGGAIPLAAPILPGLNPAIGYLLLALAAGFQLIDKYFGYSSAWMRYVAFGLHLNSELLKLQLEFARAEDLEAAESAKWEIIQQYARRLANTVDSETKDWTIEFGENAKRPEYLVDPSTQKTHQ